MGTNKTKLRIVLTPEEQSELERTARSFAVARSARVGSLILSPRHPFSGFWKLIGSNPGEFITGSAPKSPEMGHSASRSWS